MTETDRGKAIAHLYLSLLGLSLACKEQISLFPDWVPIANELAEEFNTAMNRLRHWGPGEVAAEDVDVLDGLDKLLGDMSIDRSLWSNDALCERAEWVRVRQIAASILQSKVSRWPDVPRSDLELIFGPPARGSAD